MSKHVIRDVLMRIQGGKHCGHAIPPCPRQRVGSCGEEAGPLSRIERDVGLMDVTAKNDAIHRAHRGHEVSGNGSIDKKIAVEIVNLADG